MRKALVKTLCATATLGFLATAGLASCGGGSDDKGGKESYDLIYRSWDVGTKKQNNEERQLVAMFEKEHNVKVKIVENAGSGNAYWDGIKASVFNKIDCADVMMIPNIDWPLRSQFLYDVTDLVANDAEFASVPSSIREACTFKSGTYALPARMNLQGYFLNKTLVERNLNLSGVNSIGCNSKFDVIENIITAAEADKTVVALDTAAHFIDTQASVLDPTGKQGYFTWDGEQYHLDEEPFIKSVQYAANLFQKGKTLDSYDDLAREELGLDPDVPPNVDAWNKGKLALRYGYTYEIPDMLASNELNNEYKFIGNPGGKITIVGDYYGIYKETKNPELAYEFAKWMSFGKEGFQARMDLFFDKGTINTLPLTSDPELVDAYFQDFGDTSSVLGIEEAFEYIKTKSMVEGVKVLPGFLQARQNKRTGIDIVVNDAPITNVDMFTLLDNCYKGGLNIADYTTGATNIDTLADKCYADWLKKYGENYQ